MNPEKRLPFIAAVISGVITWVATLFFLRQYLGFMTIVLILAIALARFEPWAFIGSFLIGLAIELFNKGAVAQLRVVVLLLAGGSILQAIVAFSYKPSGTSYIPSSTGQNTVFALIGLAFNRVIQFMTCPPGFVVDAKSNLIQVFLSVMNCHSRQAVETLSRASPQQDYGPAYWNAVALVCLRAFLISPALWAAFFAALRQVRFNLLEPGRVLSQTFKGLIGMALTGFLTWVIMLLFGFTLFLMGPAIASSTSQEGLTTIFFVVFLSVDAFLGALGAGWGASW